MNHTIQIQFLHEIVVVEQYFSIEKRIEIKDSSIHFFSKQRDNFVQLIIKILAYFFEASIICVVALAYFELTLRLLDDPKYFFNPELQYSIFIEIAHIGQKVVPPDRNNVQNLLIYATDYFHSDGDLKFV